MLACNVQAHPRARIQWLRRLNQLLDEPIESDHRKYLQVSGLLLINRLHRNDSGTYVCQASNSLGEERLELELLVRGK